MDKGEPDRREDDAVLVAILVFDGVVITEALGPYEVLHRLPGVEVAMVGLSRGHVHERTGALRLEVGCTIEEAPRPDVLVIPGGLGEYQMLRDRRALAWVRGAHETSTWTTSVGLGSLLLAKAGILQGVEATTHWAFQDQLAQLGAIPVTGRVVERGKVITSAGVTAGIDMALSVAEHLCGALVASAVQLWIEYDPQPPFDCGTLGKATGEVVAMATELLDDR